MIEQHTGLYGKYIVTKAENEEPVTDCFVLRPSKDSAAVRALQAYAEATDDKQLSDDIFKWVGKPLQKPLTVEELLEIAHKTEECDRTVWMEDATGWADGIAFHVCSVVYDSDEEAFIHYMLGDDNSFETEPSHYGKTWRCWATKPTDEERQAAPWE